jgi:hypothetical protein
MPNQKQPKKSKKNSNKKNKKNSNKKNKKTRSVTRRVYSPVYTPVGVPGKISRKVLLEDDVVGSLHNNFDQLSFAVNNTNKHLTHSMKHCEHMSENDIQKTFREGGLPYEGSNHSELCSRLGAIQVMDRNFYSIQSFLKDVRKVTDNLCQGMPIEELKTRMMSLGLPINGERQDLCERFALAIYLDQKTRDGIEQTKQLSY